MTAALTAAQKEALDLFASGDYRLEKPVRFLTEEQLDKSPDQKEPVKITFGQIIKIRTDHLSEHIATFEAIKQKHGI